MVFKNKAFNKFWRFSCSFQLGIPVMVLIAVLTAWGTFVEAQFNDATAAKKMVFDSWMMWVAMILLVYNLTVVVIDRLPWKLHHYPFIVVHAGIIMIVVGGYLTSQFGLDGQMSVPIQGKNNFVAVSQTDLIVYATFDGDRYSKVVDREVDFHRNPPTPQKPEVIQLGDDRIEILKFVPYGVLQNKVKATQDLNAGASIRFQLMNANVKQVQQITQQKKGRNTNFNLGPAQVILGSPKDANVSGNQIYIEPVDSEKVKFSIFHKDQAKVFKTGLMKIGDVVDTGWMALEFRLLDYIQTATEEYDVTEVSMRTDVTVPVVQLRHRDMIRWLALNDMIKIFGEKSAYLFGYQNRRLNLGFNLHLNQFDVIHYEGTNRAKEYASQVSIGPVEGNLPSEAEKIQISMNKPLKHDGYTIYQASFSSDEMTGKPNASVFSINRDPGRTVKYVGSLVLSFGIIWLFYQRRKKATAV